jgi:adenylosuccinate synthase
MSVMAVVGANFGDEGKGKIADALAATASYVARFQGGANAGHTVINDWGKFGLHLLPCGVFRPGVVNVLGPGVAVDVDILMLELEHLAERGVPTPTLRVSHRAHVVLPYHRDFDVYEEERLGVRSFGSTRRGIAPFYADKHAKVGVPIDLLSDEVALRAHLASTITMKNVLLEHLYRKPLIDVDRLLEELLGQREHLRPFLCDTTALLREALRVGENVLLEGQLGALRDVDHGIYPYTTSSSTLAGFASIGAGVPPWAIQRIVAVTKAYATSVGAGPFVTELRGSDADELRRRGGDAGEYGVTTGRPRRVGWFDAVATRYGCQLQGATELALTGLDVLGYLPEIPICVSYEIDGESQGCFPTSRVLEHASPRLEPAPGWNQDIRACRRFEDLPVQAQRYVARIEELVEVPIHLVSIGPHRNALLERC